MGKVHLAPIFPHDAILRSVPQHGRSIYTLINIQLLHLIAKFWPSVSEQYPPIIRWCGHVGISAMSLIIIVNQFILDLIVGQLRSGSRDLSESCLAISGTQSASDASMAMCFRLIGSGMQFAQRVHVYVCAFCRLGNEHLFVVGNSIHNCLINAIVICKRWGLSSRSGTVFCSENKIKYATPTKIN